jgi:uncharacterized membrane protein YdjX (TVP38/TMEM64 family)
LSGLNTVEVCHCHDEVYLARYEAPAHKFRLFFPNMKFPLFLKGPVIIVSGYIVFGPVWTFSVIAVGMILPMTLLYFLRNRFIRVINENTKEESRETVPMTGYDPE